MNYIKQKLPSRNWMIFWTTTGSIAGCFFYDKHRIHRILQHYETLASEIGNQPVAWNEPNKKITILVDPESWGSYWFEEGMKPVFDKAGVEYQIIDPDDISDLIKEARNLMWDARVQQQDDKEYQEKVAQWEAKRGWWTWLFGYGLNEQERELVIKREEEQIVSQNTPHLYKPRYNPNVSLIAIGPNAWRHLLYGLEIGLTTPIGDTELKEWTSEREEMENVKMPIVGYASCKTIKGFTRFPIRMFNWFTKRYQIEIVAKQALDIVHGKVRPFQVKDWEIERDSFNPTPKKKEDEKNAIKELWTEKAESTSHSPTFASTLSIYE